MKNKKFAITLSLEENQELMNEIDGVIRERVKMIVREEAEKMLGGSIDEEVKRVVSSKIGKMSKFDIVSAVSSAISRIVKWDGNMAKYANEAMEKWCKDHEYVINHTIGDTVSRKLNGVVQTDVIEAVANALQKKVSK